MYEVPKWENLFTTRQHVERFRGSISEVIIFENLRKAAERISELEDLDEDRWSTVEFLCSNFKKFEKGFKELEKEHQKLEQENEKLNTQITQLNENYARTIEFQEEILTFLRNLKV